MGGRLPRYVHTLLDLLDDAGWFVEVIVQGPGWAVQYGEPGKPVLRVTEPTAALQLIAKLEQALPELPIKFALDAHAMLIGFCEACGTTVLQESYRDYASGQREVRCGYCGKGYRRVVVPGVITVGGAE